MKKINVMLLGDIDIREQARFALAEVERVEIVGELSGFADRHLRFVEEMIPDVVVVDGAAFDFDAHNALSKIRRSGAVRNLVVVTPVSWSRQKKIDFGADAVVSTLEELRAAVQPGVAALPIRTDLERAA